MMPRGWSQPNHKLATLRAGSFSLVGLGFLICKMGITTTLNSEDKCTRMGIAMGLLRVSVLYLLPNGENETVERDGDWS